MSQKEKGKSVNLLLPESYDCGLARQTRSNSMVCGCKWCQLAKLNGPVFLQWQKKVTGKNKPKVIRLYQHCYLGVEEGRSHKSSASSLLAVQNLTASLPKDIKEKLAVEILRERAVETKRASVTLAQASGGHPVQVEIGKQATVQPKEQLSCKDVLSMAASANLTGKQTNSVLADMRVCIGR